MTWKSVVGSAESLYDDSGFVAWCVISFIQAITLREHCYDESENMFCHDVPFLIRQQELFCGEYGSNCVPRKHHSHPKYH